MSHPHLILRLAILGAITGHSCAYAAAPDAGQLLREQEQTIPRSLDRLPSAEPEVVRPALPDTRGVKVQVRSVRFSGGEGMASDEELQAQVQSAIGRTLSFNELQQLADRVTQYLKSKGWFLARAYLPKQDVTDGVIEIAILRGRIDSGADGQGLHIQAQGVRLTEEHMRATLAQALMADSEKGLRSGNLERGLLLLNDLPGVTARSSLERGSAQGTTRVNINVSEGPLVTGNAWVDNYGNRYTGKIRANTQVALNDPLRIGDQVTLFAAGAEGLTSARLGYSLPIGYDGLRASVGYSALNYDIGEELESLESEGSARTFDARLTYPFVRSRAFNFWGNVGYDHKALKDETLGAVTHDKRVSDWTAGINGDAFDDWMGGGLTNFSFGMTLGDLDLSRVAADLASDAATAQSDGSFTKFNYSVARLQRLSDRFTFFASWNGQVANQNLDSSEKFILGGPGGVRAFATGEASGDEGWLSNLELRYDLPGAVHGGNVQVVGFFDTGYITLSEQPWGAAANITGDNTYRLSGGGFGLNYTKTGSYALRAAWAAKIGDNPGRSTQGNDADGNHADSRFWLQALLWF